MNRIINKKPIILLNSTIKDFLYGFIAFVIIGFFTAGAVWTENNYVWATPVVMIVLHFIVKSLKPYLPKDAKAFKPFYKKGYDFIMEYIKAWIESIKTKRLDIA